ncbi:terminase small subunit [Streptomyces phage Psst4]|uniref:AAA-ATPase n=5 Tax=Rimavirus TaxID=2560214 RepID=A0A649VVT0_9CAUD|nr:terminase small subunit [Streptomyces phage DrGrey]QAY17090.1 hypothetical protein SEA_POPY_56 [Streptomyces phage Popy]QEQ93835.1 hypothetical protein SEA_CHERRYBLOSSOM_56 [Streptomyces phage CherryBlossom]QEQ94668.1 hypothetical protein SEA_SOSHI_55 [Streptomyces phage Soshi]QGJ96596.1 hypothetical protein SEA_FRODOSWAGGINS_56 [Streptomyces phage FrodoSwaggins]WPJ30799.1 terminase small subunit [Streptomyces phage Psst4]
MNNLPKAYNELMERLLEPEDRRKLEIVVGAMLTGGPPQTVLISGPVRSGKTTLMKIVKRLITLTTFATGSPRVLFQHDGFQLVELAQPTFVFAETHILPREMPGAVFIQTTGDRLPVNKYYVLMDLIDSELDEIAEHCIRTYHNAQENNR